MDFKIPERQNHELLAVRCAMAAPLEACLGTGFVCALTNGLNAGLRLF